jgi:hypothetical protein
MAERSSSFTASADRKTSAASGCNTTAVVLFNFAAKRLGFAFESSNAYSLRSVSRSPFFGARFMSSDFLRRRPARADDSDGIVPWQPPCADPIRIALP